GVLGGAERTRDQGLRLAAREDGRTVRPRQHARLNPDRADLVETPAVEAAAPLEHLVAEHALLELLEDLLGLELPLDFAFRNRSDQIVEDLVDAIVVLQLPADPHRLGERYEDLLLDLAVEVVANLALRHRHFGPPDFPRQIVDR